MQATSVVNAYSSQSASAIFTPLVGTQRREGTSSGTSGSRSTAWKAPQQQEQSALSPNVTAKGESLLRSGSTFFFNFTDVLSPSYLRDALNAYQEQWELGVPQRAVAAPRPDAPPQNPVPDASPQVYGDPSGPIPMVRMTPGVLVDTYA